MNKLKYVARLQAIFSQYPNVYLHPKCMEEILTFTIATGNEARFLCTLERYLRFMHNNDISLWVKKMVLKNLKTVTLIYGLCILKEYIIYEFYFPLQPMALCYCTHFMREGQNHLLGTNPTFLLPSLV